MHDIQIVGRDFELSENPLVSIIVPVYNVEKYLPKCIDSIINQKYINIEIICVNDGSTDGSLKLLNSYKEQDSRVLIINKENRGVSAARNDALKIAQGEYVLFVDADDWIDDFTLKIAITMMQENDSDIVMWSYVSEHIDKSIIKHVWNENKVFDKKEVSGFLCRKLIGPLDEELCRPELVDCIAPVWGKLYKRSLLDDVEFVDLNKIGSYEDGLFNYYVFRKANKVVYIDNPMYHYVRYNSLSQTSAYNSKLFLQWQNLFSLMQDRIRDNENLMVFEKALNNRIALSILGLGLNVVSSDSSLFEKRRMIADIVTNSRYIKVYKQLELNYFPLHWKVFYFCVKHRLFIMVYMLLLIISRIIN